MLPAMVAVQPPRDAPRAPMLGPPRVSVCRWCGVVAPTKQISCTVCSKPLAETRVEVASPSVDLFWVAVRCGFTCNSCRFLAPLDALDADGSVNCARCGLTMRFDVPLWTPALDFAHAVGDLAGPMPEGRSPHATLWMGSENPHANIGLEATFAHVDSGVLSVDAAPGHPICRRCHVPLAVRVAEPGTIDTSCATCGENGRYSIAQSARTLSQSLVAVIADEHRSDRPRARAATTDGGVTSLHCPSCGAPLGVPDHSGIAACTFCKAACVIPARVRSRARNETPAPDVWWMLFQGLSQQRRVLEAPTAATLSSTTWLKDGLNFGGKQNSIGEQPGVYDAPEVRGIYLPQLAVTALSGTLAVALGTLLYELFRR
jgi:hypothetical protein